VYQLRNEDLSVVICLNIEIDERYHKPEPDNVIKFIFAVLRCSVVGTYKRFEVTNFLHLQGRLSRFEKSLERKK
jgi:hypothetical protein